MKVDTIKIKADNAQGYKLINASDYDADVHTPFDAEAKAAVKQSEADRQANAKLAAERRAQGNYGQVDGNAPGASDRNPSGTFSEPTPSDVRYPDKTATEFENNHGAFVGKSAAQIRQDEGLEDAPGGLQPDPSFAPGTEEVTEAAKDAPATDPLDHDKNGKKGGSVPKADDKK